MVMVTLNRKVIAWMPLDQDGKPLNIKLIEPLGLSKNIKQ